MVEPRVVLKVVLKVENSSSRPALTDDVMIHCLESAT